MTPRTSSLARTRERVYRILHSDTEPDTLARSIRLASAVLIVVNVIAVVIESVESIERAIGGWLDGIEVVSVMIFSAEYLLRVWSAPEGRPEMSAMKARLRYVFSFFGLIDLLAILPFYIEAFFTGDLRIVRAMRLLRLERVFLLGRYSRGFRAIANAMRSRKPELVATTFITGVMLLITSSLLYYVEHDAQPDKFASIPESLWWGVVTLTSVGYGDIYPITPLGKLLGGLIALLGIAIVAMPSGIIVSGFLKEMEEESVVTCPSCGERVEVK